VESAACNSRLHAGRSAWDKAYVRQSIFARAEAESTRVDMVRRIEDAMRSGFSNLGLDEPGDESSRRW